ncbi:MAG: 3'-5' exonuclease [Spirochaetes bacterium]|nr:MAG: 3'-5' exonuclease [Spirochaetota bacterium]
MGFPMSNKSFRCFLDTETTGLNTRKDQIIEICLVLEEFDPVRPFLRGNIIRTFTRKVKPTTKVSEKAAAINGYTPEAWKYAPYFYEIADEVAEILSLATEIVGHNISYDRAIVEEAMIRCSGHEDFSFHHTIDTATLAYEHWVFTGHISSRSLTAVTKHLGIEHSKAHSAESDVFACREVFYRAMEKTLGISITHQEETKKQ